MVVLNTEGLLGGTQIYHGARMEMGETKINVIGYQRGRDGGAV